jgi:hypothetical protein
MSVPQAAFALQTLLVLVAGVLLLLVGETDASEAVGIGCVVASITCQVVIGVLLVLDAITAEQEAKADAAEQERLAKVQPTVPGPAS